MRASNSTEDAQIEPFKPVFGQLYSSQSSSSKDALQRTTEGVEKVLSLDRETEAMIDRLPESARIRQDPLKILRRACSRGLASAVGKALRSGRKTLVVQMYYFLQVTFTHVRLILREYRQPVLKTPHLS